MKVIIFKILPKVVRSNFALASKLLFKLARDDTNDHRFLSRRSLELYLSAGLGRNCPLGDNEAFTYGYGALKFLTLNNKVSIKRSCHSAMSLNINFILTLCDII